MAFGSSTWRGKRGAIQISSNHNRETSVLLLWRKKNEFTRNFERCHVMYEWARSITMQHSSSSSRIPHKKMPFAFYLDGESHYAADTATAASQLSQSVIAHSPTIIKSSKIDPHMVV